MSAFITQKDSFDGADLPYEPPLLNLPATCPPSDLHRRLLGTDNQFIRNQGTQPYCTAMALASVIDFLVLQRDSLRPTNASVVVTDEDKDQVQDDRCSARMLYEMAKAFDEYPDDDNYGSSLRGAIKGFYHNGVYRRPHDEHTETAEWKDPDWIFDIDKAKKSRQTVLGQYARLGASILHYQAAIVHNGIVYASASIHSGWERISVQDHEGVIYWDPRQPSIGNHAFALVGYNESGFLVLNSFGTDWGGWSDSPHWESGSWPGIALWRYDDWSNNILDAWVLRLGVPIELEQFRRIAQAQPTTYRFGGSQGQGTTRLLINGHYLHMSDGRLVDTGVFANNQASVEQTASLLEKSITDPNHEGVERRKYSDLVLVVESGLQSIDAMANRCSSYVGQLLSSPEILDGRFTPYPISIFWQKDVQQVVEDLLASRSRRIESRTGGFADAKAHMLDAYAREFMQPIWRAFEGEAERSFQPDNTNKRGKGWTAMQRLLVAAASNHLPMGIHFVVHGSGMPWFQALVERLVTLDPMNSTYSSPVLGLHDVESRRRLLRSVTLIAPICTPKSLLQLVGQLWGDWHLPIKSAPPPLAIFSQPACRDADENLGGYQGSFLELARRCFPLDGSLPSFTCPNEIVGHPDGLCVVEKQLAGCNLLETLHLPNLNAVSHADLMDCPSMVKVVFERLKERSICAP